jgi:hypothetical protein
MGARCEHLSYHYHLASAATVSSQIPVLSVSKDKKPHRQPIMTIQILESARDPTLANSSNTTTLIGHCKEFK